MAVKPPCTNSGATPGANTPGMPCDVCAEAGEVKSATKTVKPEILRISAENLFRLEVMAPSLLGPKYHGPTLYDPGRSAISVLRSSQIRANGSEGDVLGAKCPSTLGACSGSCSRGISRGAQLRDSGSPKRFQA